MESNWDYFHVRDSMGSTLYSGTGSGSFGQLLEGDQATECIASDTSGIYTGYTVAYITYI